MADDFYRRLTKIIKKHGGVLDRQAKGSHEKWVMPDGRPGFVPNPCKRRHTANGVLKLLGIDEKL